MSGITRSCRITVGFTSFAIASARCASVHVCSTMSLSGTSERRITSPTNAWSSTSSTEIPDSSESEALSLFVLFIMS